MTQAIHSFIDEHVVFSFFIAALNAYACGIVIGAVIAL
jgi:hypothetical protein